MDNQQRLQECRDLLKEICFLIHFEKTRCDTHAQRNAAMHLVRVASEKLDQELRILEVAPTNHTIDEIPF